MGSGKSSIGRLVAKKLRYRFVDTDAMIVLREKAEIPEIFARKGEEYFRDLETEALDSLRLEHGLVIATGGGIVTRPDNLTRLRELGVVVWLAAAEGVIFERVSRNKNRPLLHTENPRATIRELLAGRTPLYENAAQLTIDTSEGPHEEIADRVIRETASLEG